MKNKEDLSGMNAEQLAEQVASERVRLQRLRFAHAVTPLENANQLILSRRRIARLMTAHTAANKQA